MLGYQAQDKERRAADGHEGQVAGHDAHQLPQRLHRADLTSAVTQQSQPKSLAKNESTTIVAALASKLAEYGQQE